MFNIICITNRLTKAPWMKKNNTKAALIILIHHTIYAFTLSSVLILLAYLKYVVTYKLGITVLRKAGWIVPFVILFIGTSLLINYLFYYKFKRSKLTLSDYGLMLRFEKDFLSRETILQLLRRQMFEIESETEKTIVAKRSVGKLIKREQELLINLEDKKACYEVKVKNTLYPIDYFLHNYHVKLSFLNNPT